MFALRCFVVVRSLLFCSSVDCLCDSRLCSFALCRRVVLCVFVCFVSFAFMISVALFRRVVLLLRRVVVCVVMRRLLDSVCLRRCVCFVVVVVRCVDLRSRRGFRSFAFVSRVLFVRV